MSSVHRQMSKIILVLAILISSLSIRTTTVAAHQLPEPIAADEISQPHGTAYPTFLRGPFPLPARLQAAALQDTEAAREFLKLYAQRFGIKDVDQELQSVQTAVDTLGMSHVTFQQVVHGLLVYQALLKVHLNRGTNEVLAVGNGYIAGIRLETVTPRFDAEYARRIAAHFLPGDRYNKPPALVIYPGVGGQRAAAQARLAWLVERQNRVEHRLFVVDALDGKLIDVLERSYSNHLSQDETYNAAPIIPAITAAKQFATYSAQHAETLPGVLARVDDEPPVGDVDVDHAHERARITYNYYLNTHSRNSFDDNGAIITSTVHYGQNMQNAYWNGEQMIYGDGFPTLDIVGHELTHAVTQHTANLEYRWQSGALNESFSDIFGVMIDRDDWTLGEEIAPDVFGQEAFRDMANPERFNQPGHTDGWVKTCFDQEGVHTNSGIFNKAYYTIATAIGKEKAERIFYRTLTQYLQPTSSFQDARAAVLQATNELDASVIVSVTQGFEDVGITANWQPPANECVCVAIASVTAPHSTETLDLLYMVRDDLMATTATGRYYTALYYKTSATISTLLLANPDLRTDTAAIIELMRPGLHNLAADKGDDSLVTAEMIDSIRQYLTELKSVALAAGNHDLVNQITVEEARIDWTRLPGMTFAEAWGYLNSLGGFFSVFLPVMQR